MNKNQNHCGRLSLLLLPSLLSFLPTPSSSSDPIRQVKVKLNTPPPIPILPLPSASQLRWQEGEMAMFLHFGPNTFTGSEWGSGESDPNAFNPTRLDAGQWARVASDAGFSRVLLTAKHHDGFCLWPTNYTDYSVRSSTWRGGSGDVVADLAEAVKREGIGMGLYLSPWDRHEGSYGRTLEYNEFYMAQMTELLTRYGEITDVFLDGAKGEGEKEMEYFFDLWFDLVHQLQPGAAIFSDAGPDSRWIGNEAGLGSSTCWSLFNCSNCAIADCDSRYAGTGDPMGHDWVAAECDASIRPGWFWHASESPKPAKTLLELYYNTVGKNCLLLLNVPPNSSGLISPQDTQALREFTELRNSIFSVNLASEALAAASSTRGSDFDPRKVLEEGIYSYWAPGNGCSVWDLELDLGESVSFNVVKIQEPIQMGQRIAEFRVEFVDNGEWNLVASGTTVGYQRLLRFPTVNSRFLRLVITESRAEPLVSFLGVYIDRVSTMTDRDTQFIHRVVVKGSRTTTM